MGKSLVSCFFETQCSFQKPKISAKFDRGHPLQGAPNACGVGQNRRLSTNNRLSRKRYKKDAWFLLKSNRKSYALYRMVSGDIADDLECPLTAPNHPIFSAFCTAIHSSVAGKPRDFKFGTLTYHRKSHPADKKSSLKGAWSGSADPF